MWTKVEIISVICHVSDLTILDNNHYSEIVKYSVSIFTDVSAC
jgi:hypothetical protein